MSSNNHNNQNNSNNTMNLQHKLATHWADKISGLHHFIQLTSSSSSSSSPSTVNDTDRLSFLQKTADRIRHCSASTTPAFTLRSIFCPTMASSSNNSNNNSSQVDSRELARIVKTISKNNNDDVNGEEMKVEVLVSSFSATPSPTQSSVLSFVTMSDASQQHQSTSSSASLFQEGDVVCGIIDQRSDDETQRFIITGVVLPASASSSSLDLFLNSSLELLRNQFACLVPGLPLVTALSLKESSSWSRFRMSVMNHSFFHTHQQPSSLASTATIPRNELALIEKLLHHSVSSSQEKRAAIVSEYLLGLSSSSSGHHHHHHESSSSSSSLLDIFRKQSELLSLVASVFADDLNDAIVERSGCTATWWRHKLLFSSCPFFISQILSSFFLANVVWQKQHNSKTARSSSTLDEVIEDEEMIEYFTEILLKIVANVGKHVERVLSLIFPSSASAPGVDLTTVGPLGLLSLCEETAESLAVIALVLRSWKDLVSSEHHHHHHHQSSSSNNNVSSSSTISLSDEHPQIELPSHVEGDSLKEQTYIRQAAADLILIAPTTITRAQICVVDAILKGIDSVVEHVSSVSSASSSSSLSEQSLWFAPQQQILPTIPDGEVGALPIAEQLLRLQISLLDRIHAQSLKTAEEAQLIVDEKFAKIWQQQQQAMRLLSSNATVSQNQQQQLQLLNSLSNKLESSIGQLLLHRVSSSSNNNNNIIEASNNNNNSGTSSTTAAAYKMIGRLISLKILKMVSHLLLKEKVLSVGYRRELSSLMLDDNNNNNDLNSYSSSSIKKSNNETAKCTSSFSAVFEPNCVGSWVENDLNAAVLSRTSPRVSVLRDSSSELNGRLLLHGRRVVNKDLKKQNNKNNNDNENDDNNDERKPSLGVLVVCAAGQNMWLIWFTVAAVIPLRQNHKINKNDQKSEDEDDLQQRQEDDEEEEEEVAIAINLLHQEASLVQALMGAADMSRQDMIDGNGQTESDFAGSFCLFMNSENDPTVSNWISSVTSQANANVSLTASSSLKQSRDADRESLLFKSLPNNITINSDNNHGEHDDMTTMKRENLKRENDQEQEQQQNPNSNDDRENEHQHDDSKENEKIFIRRTIKETLKSFETEFTLSREQKKVVENSVFNSVGHHRHHHHHHHDSDNHNETDETSSDVNVICGHGFTRCGKSTTLIHAAAIRARTVQALKSFRLENSMNVPVPNASAFSAQMMTASSSSSLSTMMMMDDASSTTSPTQLRNRFLHELARFQHHSELDSPTLFICQGSETAETTITQLQHKLQAKNTVTSSRSGGVQQQRQQQQQAFRLSHHFNSSLSRCQKAPFVQNLLRQQREQIIKRLSDISFTLADSSSRTRKEKLFSDSRLKQVLSPTQFKTLLQMRRVMAMGNNSNDNNTTTTAAKIFPMNRELYEKVFASNRREQNGEQIMQEEESNFFFDQDLANEIESFASCSSHHSSSFGIKILPLQSLEYLNTASSNGNNNNNTNSHLTSDYSLLSRLDFARHTLAITQDLETSITNAIRSRCVVIIKKEQEELFSRLLMLNAIMRDVVESTAVQSIKSQPGRVIVVDAERDLLDFRYGGSTMMLSPLRLQCRSIFVDDAEKIFTAAASGSLVVSSCLIFRSLLSTTSAARGGTWSRGMTTSNNNNSKNDGKTSSQITAATTSAISSIFTLSWDPSLVIESLKLCARNDDRVAALATSAVLRQRNSHLHHQGAPLLLPLVNFPISAAHRLLLTSTIHSLIQNKIQPLIKNLSHNQSHHQHHHRQHYRSRLVLHVNLTDEEIISKSTNFYLNSLRRIISNSSSMFQRRGQNENDDGSDANANDADFGKEPHTNTVFKTTTLLSRSLARHVSLWAIPVPSFSHVSNNNNNNRGGGGGGASKKTDPTQTEEEELLMIRRQEIATKIFFKCLTEALESISNLIDVDDAGKSGGNNENNNNSGIAFVSENGNLLSVSSSPNMTKLSSILTSRKKSSSLTIFSDIESFSAINIDSLVLIIVPNFVLSQRNRHLSIHNNNNNNNRNRSSGLDSCFVSSTSPQMKDLFCETLTFTASSSSDSSSSAAQLLLRVSGSILCLSTSEIFDQALLDQNNIIIANAEVQLHQMEIANAGNKLGVLQNQQQQANSGFLLSSSSVNGLSSTWLRQLIQTASFARSPIYLCASNTLQERANLIADTDSMFYGANADSQSAAAAIVFSKNRHNNEDLLRFVQDSLLKKSHGPALEVCCSRHQQQVRGFLLFSIDADFFVVGNRSNQNDITKNNSNNSGDDNDEMMIRKQRRENEKRLREEEDSINELIASTQFIQRLLPRHNQQQQIDQDAAAAGDSSSSSSCSGLFGRCKLACLSKYEKCNVRSHMCLQQCHHDHHHHNEHDYDEDYKHKNSQDQQKQKQRNICTRSNKFHLTHQTPCPFLCNKKLPCSHSCAQDCGAAICQCPFASTPVVIIERTCGEHCIIGVDADKNPISAFYKHKVIIPCSGMDPNASGCFAQHLLPPCQEPVQVACEKCQTIISCLCCDVDTFRGAIIQNSNGEVVLENAAERRQQQDSNSSSHQILCNLCRDPQNNPAHHQDLEKVILRNKLLAKRTGLLAAAAAKDESGIHSTTERVQRILRRHEELRLQSDAALKNAMEQAKKRMMSDVMKAKETFGRQEQLLSELNAHRIQFMNIIRRNV